MVKEVRHDRCDTSLSTLHQDSFKLEREVRVDKDDTLTSCLHPTKCKVSNATRNDRGDTSTSCALQFGRTRVRNLTSDDANLTSSSSPNDDMSSSYRQAHSRRAVWLTLNRLGIARPERKLSTRRANAEGNATKPV